MALAAELNQIEWIYAKSKPIDWHLPWSGEADGTVDRIFRPDELVSDKAELLVGCVCPVYDPSEFKLAQNNSSVMNAFLITLGLDDKQLVQLAIKQLKFADQILTASSNTLD